MQIVDLKESIRKRPFMYLGSGGIEGLLTDFIVDCISRLKTDKLTFTISVLGENDFSISLIPGTELRNILDDFHLADINGAYIHFDILKILSNKFEFDKEIENQFLIKFSFDKSVIADTMVDYQALCEKALQVAILNKQVAIITKDLREKIPSQNYYHLPQGVFYLFNRIVKRSLSAPVFKITFDEMVQDTHYQIGLAYRNDWYP
ncbi:MAG TPA: hypothetical protein VIM77_15190, partial [Mucilaginibacter sp.]